MLSGSTTFLGGKAVASWLVGKPLIKPVQIHMGKNYIV